MSRPLRNGIGPSLPAKNRASRRVSPIAFLASISSVGCILAISPESGGAHCRLRGVETECTRCLSNHCEREIDTACFDESVLSVVERCAERGDDACDRLPPSRLTTCVAAHCRTLCYRRVGTSKTNCAESFASPGMACSCRTDTADVNDLACTSTFYPRTRCCAPLAWPGPALECTCNAIACHPSAGGCGCILTNNLDEDMAERCLGQHCCAVDDRCQCRPRACSGGERAVPECNRDAVGCPPGTKEVESCAIRE